MRKTLFLGFLLIILSSLGGCGEDSSKGPDPTEVCPTICEKEADCDLLGNTTYEDCVAECLGYAENMLVPYLEAITTCTQEKSCEELEEGVTAQGLCYEENVALCTTDTEAYVEAACLKNFECEGIDDPSTEQMSACLDQMHADGNILICFQKSAVDDLIDCIESAQNCNPNPVNTCAKDVVGLDLGNANNHQ